MRALLASAASIVLSEPACADSSGRFLCIPELTGGIEYNSQTGQWQSAEFSTKDKFTLNIEHLTKFVSALDIEMGYYKISIYQFGSNTQGQCLNTRTGAEEIPFVDGFGGCRTVASNYRFKSIDYRLIQYYRINFEDGQKPNGGNTPATNGGICSRLN